MVFVRFWKRFANEKFYRPRGRRKMTRCFVGFSFSLKLLEIKKQNNINKAFFILNQNFMNLIYALIGAIVINIFGIRVFRKMGILDKPGNDLKNTRKPVPTILGVFTYLGFGIIVAILFPEYLSNRLFLGLMAGAFPIMIVQLLDELRYIDKIKLNLPSRIRLISHVVGAVLAVYVWGFEGQEILIGNWSWIMPQRFFAIFFVLWSILCINAINRFDGIYAQSSGVSSIGFLTIFLLIKFVVFQHFTVFTEESIISLNLVQNLSLILFVISLVSTVIEYKPIALLRDVGIMFFGFALAYLSIAGWAKIWTVVVALSLVIFDAIWVAFWKIFVMKKSPLKWDYTHLHHRLLGLGWNRKEIRAFVWSFSSIMMILMLMQEANRINKIWIFLIMAIVFFGVNYYLFLVKKLPCGLKIKKNN